ncbi:heterokaryon incompatibility protein-domain-containing protein [Apodospora peruviana]|uniref:Heterokaryon incompatibility protein-domain-containing protein n=1 Tax=Apodospora peruviana TaxID=516989 RepID=A0AAE0MA77_9PEZI|nr:heterokaryon incompatibility protein-domain-containing protein [Apodospora peruviana]
MSVSSSSVGYKVVSNATWTWDQQLPRGSIINPQFNRLCDTCRSNFPPDGPWPSLVQFDRGPQSEKKELLFNGIALQTLSSAVQLKASSNAGCHLCTVILGALHPFVVSDDQADDSIEAIFGNSTLQIYILPGVPGIIYWALSVFPSAIQQLKEWLRVCTEEHPNCRCPTEPEAEALRSDSPRLRLVDIGTHADDVIRIVDVGALQHCTLSYRWTAEVKQTSLKVENRFDFYQSIPNTQGWPKVYQDAVSVVRQLGVRYLWIDSLCIIQDHIKDWIEQAALMDRTYSRGLLNLAAVEADRVPGL